MKSYGFILFIGILIGMIIRSLIITESTRAVEDMFEHKNVQIDSLESVVQGYHSTVKYIDLDQRLYTPYDDDTITRHYENIVSKSYDSDSTKFLIVHDIKISKLK